MAVEQKQFYGILRRIDQVIEVSEPDKVSLIAFFIQISDIGFLYLDGIPVVLLDLVDNFNRRNEVVLVADLVVSVVRT